MPKDLQELTQHVIVVENNPNGHTNKYPTQNKPGPWSSSLPLGISVLPFSFTTNVVDQCDEA